MSLPVLPLHIHDALGFGPFIIGATVGAQFIASLLSRLWAGRLVDGKGPRIAVLVGLILTAASGLFYLLSLELLSSAQISLICLIAGRVLVGCAESLIVTGGVTWVLGLSPAQNTARAIAWAGMAIFTGLAAGAPLGSAIYAHWRFSGVALLVVAISMFGLLAIRKVPACVLQTGPRQAAGNVLRAILLPGLAFSLSGISYGAITAFLTLYFSVQNWAGGAWAFSGFALMLISTRVVIGHLPDRFGGARITIFSLFAQASGLVLIGCATEGWMALVGAGLCGAGYSLVYPGLGLEVIRLVPPESRGTAMGLFNACLDLALGIAIPSLGGLAAIFGVGAVFFASAVAAILAIPIAMKLVRQSSSVERGPAHE